jgi:hypothetical protein
MIPLRMPMSFLAMKLPPFSAIELRLNRQLS